MKNNIYLYLMIQLIIFNKLNAQNAINLNAINSINSTINFNKNNAINSELNSALINENTPLSITSNFEEKKEKLDSFKAALLQNSATEFGLNSPKKINGQRSNFKLQRSNFKLLNPSDTFNKKRFWTLVGSGVGISTGAMLLLNNVWYAQYPRSSFHYFDDEGEWLQMDKAGHILTAYTIAKWAFNGVRWSGMKNNNAAIIGMTSGIIFQTGLEFLDGFSKEWGFSWADMGANTAGAALFGIQQMTWKEQRIILKISNTPRAYSTDIIPSLDGSKTSSLRQRADDLYGANYTQTFFKDYNALTFWLSFNPRSFNKNGRFPAWLNIAVGIGADNMFGGYVNQWPSANPAFILSEKDYPRYRQFYVSLDIDLSKIKTKSKAINTVLRTINFIKIPSPTLEINGLNQIKFHPLFF